MNYSLVVVRIIALGINTVKNCYKITKKV